MPFEMFTPIWSHVNENEKFWKTKQRKNGLKICWIGTFPLYLALTCCTISEKKKTSFTDGQWTDGQLHQDSILKINQVPGWNWLINFKVKDTSGIVPVVCTDLLFMQSTPNKLSVPRRDLQITVRFQQIQVFLGLRKFFTREMLPSQRSYRSEFKYVFFFYCHKSRNMPKPANCLCFAYTTTRNEK